MLDPLLINKAEYDRHMNAMMNALQDANAQNEARMTELEALGSEYTQSFVSPCLFAPILLNANADAELGWLGVTKLQFAKLFPIMLLYSYPDSRHVWPLTPSLVEFFWRTNAVKKKHGASLHDEHRRGRGLIDYWVSFSSD